MCIFTHTTNVSTTQSKTKQRHGGISNWRNRLRSWMAASLGKRAVCYWYQWNTLYVQEEPLLPSEQRMLAMSHLLLAFLRPAWQPVVHLTLIINTTIATHTKPLAISPLEMGEGGVTNRQWLHSSKNSQLEHKHIKEHFKTLSYSCAYFKMPAHRNTTAEGSLLGTEEKLLCYFVTQNLSLLPTK